MIVKVMKAIRRAISQIQLSNREHAANIITTTTRVATMAIHAGGNALSDLDRKQAAAATDETQHRDRIDTTAQDDAQSKSAT